MRLLLLVTFALPWLLSSGIALSTPPSHAHPLGAEPVGAPGAVRDLKTTPAATPRDANGRGQVLTPAKADSEDDGDSHTIRNSLIAAVFLSVAGAGVVVRAAGADKRREGQDVKVEKL